MKELQAEHGIGAGTAHRAIGLLKSWGLVEASRGRRAMILDSPELVASTAPEPEPEPEPDVAPSNDQAHLLDLRLLHLGDEARSFTAKADPSNPEQLHRLLAGAARRHGGKDVDVAEYELEVRRAGDPQVITTFAAL